LTFLERNVGAGMPVNGGILHGFGEYPRVAGETDIWAFGGFRNRRRRNQFLKDTQLMPFLARFREAPKRSRLGFPPHQCRIDPGFQSRRRSGARFSDGGEPLEKCLLRSWFHCSISV